MNILKVFFVLSFIYFSFVSLGEKPTKQGSTLSSSESVTISLKDKVEIHMGVRYFPHGENCENFPCWGQTAYIIFKKQEEKEYKTFYFPIDRAKILDILGQMKDKDRHNSLAVAHQMKNKDREKGLDILNQWSKLIYKNEKLVLFFRETEFRSGVLNTILAYE